MEACLPSGFEARGDETALLRRDGPAGDGADAVQKGAHLLLRPLGGQGDLVGGEQAASSPPGAPKAASFLWAIMRI